MTIFHVFVLSLIQGATEFLPVSSSAHLVLYNKFVIGLKNDLSLDIAMHIGSLLAVILLVSKPLKEHINNVLIKNGVSKSVFFLTLVMFPLVFMALFLEYARLLDLSRQVLWVDRAGNKWGRLKFSVSAVCDYLFHIFFNSSQRLIRAILAVSDFVESDDQ